MLFLHETFTVPTSHVVNWKMSTGECQIENEEMGLSSQRDLYLPNVRNLEFTNRFSEIQVCSEFLISAPVLDQEKSHQICLIFEGLL